MATVFIALGCVFIAIGVLVALCCGLAALIEKLIIWTWSEDEDE